MKDAKEEHFKVVHVNVFDVKKNANMDEYKKFSAISTKNHVVLSSVNIIDKAFCMVQLLSKKTCSIHGARSYVPSMLLDMSQSNQFYLVASWVVP